MLDREQRIVEAMMAYEQHVADGGDPDMLLWVVSTVADAELWLDLIDTLAFAAAAGPMDLSGAPTPAEQAFAAWAVTWTRTHWHMLSTGS